MKKRYILFLFFNMLLFGVSAQTLEQAKSFYNKGEYDKAKPVFKKFVKSQPANGNYNLWYGVCCLKTGEPAEGVKHLETAVKKRISSGQLYLAQTYNDLYRFEEAVKCYEEYITDLKRLKRSTEEAERLLKRSIINLRLMKGVEKVCIIDSFIVDKKGFLDAYKITPEAGKLYTYNDFFQDKKKEEEGIVYRTELGDKIYYAEKQKDGKLSILSSNKMQGSWGRGQLLPSSINDSINANYPYVLTDGLTIYYAADGENSMGGYDIFVTRYNTNTDNYLTPENVGMPFNSPYNDYMFVLDEFNNLGWFASDRYQPQDRVCVYVFIPNASKQVYDYENMDSKQLIRLAQIHSLKDTWENDKTVTNAKRRLQTATNEAPQVEQTHDFVFIINDHITCYQISDFKSSRAQTLFGTYCQLEKDLKLQQNKLENQRMIYTNANESERTRLTPAILDLEKQIAELIKEVERSAIEVRNAEIQALK